MQRKKNKKPILFLLFLLGFVSCNSTVEFIPDSDFSTSNYSYSKKSPEEVEIVFKKPDKPYKAVGSVVFRKFSGEHSLKIDHKELKEELFSRKIDGVWIPDKIEKLEGIPSLVVRTENQDGMILSLAESNLDIEKLTGIAFRYRNAGKESKSIR